jgi:ABC-type nitrate/sulfonate/bicarbonate transport system substrate-binding protein
MRRLIGVPLLAAAIAGAALLAGGGQRATAGTTPANASLVLDFTPNAIHSGIYLAKQRGYDRKHGIDLHVVVPGASTDAVKLLDAGKVNFAILDIHDLAIADAEGRNLVGIMAIVERPLASVIAQPQFKSPAALQGQTVGVTGDPSDLAVLRSEVAGAGGNPAKVKTVTIGYDAVPDLVGGRVAAATSFWNDEGVQLQQTGKGYNVFRVEKYGAPPYPELVVCATGQELKSDPALARGVVRSLVEGYRATLSHPAAAAQALESQVSGLSAQAVSEQLKGELAAFRPVGGGSPGALVPSVLRSWSRWEAKFGIVKRAPNVATMFDRAFLPKS